MSGTVLNGCPTQRESAPTAPPLRCELISDFSQMESFSAEWERLWRADPEAEIFQSLAWVRAWWRSYADEVTLFSFIVFEASRVIGIVPLVRQNGKIVFLGGKHADYGDILSENGRACDVFQAALEHLLRLPGWKECVLHNFKAGGQIHELLPALSETLRRHVQIVPCDPCQTILLGDNRDVLASLLGKDHTRRRLNKLRKAGAVTFRHIEEKAEAQSQLLEFFRHLRRRRALTGKPAPAPEFYTLLRNVVEQLDLCTELRFGALQLNCRSLAWHFSFQSNGKLLFYQQTFDVDAWDYSPGEVLIHELLHYVNKNVSREFDFARGDEPFKDRFTTHTRECYSLYIEPVGVAGQLRRIARANTIPWIRLGRRLQRHAKGHAETFHRFRFMRLWASGLLMRIRHHRKQRTLISWALTSAARPFRSIWPSKPQIQLYEGDFLKLSETRPPLPDPKSRSGLSVREGTLSDLVDIALEHPEIIVPSELAAYKRRLKQGDRVYLVQREKQREKQRQKEVVLIGWTTVTGGKDGEKDEDKNKQKNTVRSGKNPLMLLCECWIPEVPQSLYCQELICTVAKDARNQQLLLAVPCPRQGLGQCSPHSCRRI